MSTNSLSAPSNNMTVPADMISQRLCLFHLGFSQWTGKSVLRRADYTASDEDVPGAAVAANYGQKRLVDPEHLKVFATLTKRAQATLAQAGIPFFHGYVVPLEKQGEVSDALRAICDEFDAARDAFIADFDKLTAEWRGVHPQYAKSMAEATPDAQDVANRIQSGFATFKFSPLEGETEGLEKGLKGLMGELIKEVAYRAGHLRKQSVAGKTAADLTKRTLNDLKAIEAKLRSLTFLNPGVSSVLNVIERLLASMPEKATKGNFSEEHVKVLNSTLSLLENEIVLSEIAAGKVAIDDLMKSYGHVLTASAGVPQTTQETEEAGMLFVAEAEETTVSDVEAEAASEPANLPVELTANAVNETEETKEESNETEVSEELPDDLDARLAAFFEDVPPAVVEPPRAPTMVLSSF